MRHYSLNGKRQRAHHAGFGEQHGLAQRLSFLYIAADVTDKFFRLIKKIWMLTNIENLQSKN